MKLIQCDRCGEMQVGEVDREALTYVAPETLYIVKLYGRNQYKSTREVDLCRRCQELANDVMSRYMIATLKEEVDGQDNAGKDETLGQEA